MVSVKHFFFFWLLQLKKKLDNFKPFFEVFTSFSKENLPANVRKFSQRRAI